MNKLLRRVLSKEDYKKVMLIKKYAKIRFRRFWKEWGVSKEEFGMIVGALSIFTGAFVLSIIGYIF